jgi:hypothetical protein
MSKRPDELRMMTIECLLRFNLSLNIKNNTDGYSDAMIRVSFELELIGP